ncbi:MAG: hypothetical protein ACLSS9_07225 [Acutalibacteraceae bacterium]
MKKDKRLRKGIPILNTDCRLFLGSKYPPVQPATLSKRLKGSGTGNT